MTPEAAVARLAEILAARADLTEDEIYAAMAEAGIPDAVALRTLEFTRVAWGRLLLEGLAVRFSTEYFCFNAAGDVVESGLLAEQPYFVAASGLAKQYTRFQGCLRFASMSSDVNAVNSALSAGSKPEDLFTSPVALFVEGATPTAAEKARQFLERRMVETAPPTVIAKARQLLSGGAAAPANYLQTIDSWSDYVHPVYGWSVSYPAHWSIDTANPSFVRIHSDAHAAVCGIHSWGSRWNTLDELTDAILADNERFFQEKGLRLGVLDRRPISLPNGVVGNDVRTQILPHAEKSRRIYVHEGGRAFVMDCETWPENWENLEPVYDRILNSFTLPRKRPAKKWWRFWK